MTDNQQYIQFGQRKILYSLTQKARKTVRIQVLPDSTVQVTAPLGLSTEDVAKTVRHKAPWIVKQLRFFEQFHPLTPPRLYRSGETHRYLGRQYRLKLHQGETSIRLVAGFFEITLPDLTPEAIEQALTDWYRQRAEVYFRRMITNALTHFGSYALPVPELKLRKMPTRWGSCTTSGTIYLHPDLIKAVGSCIEYVIVHELCHLVHRHHNRDFYGLLDRVLPDWPRRKQTLERMMA